MRTLLLSVALASVVSIDLRAAAARPSAEDTAVRTFVTQQFVHGMPYGAARDLGPEALDTLAVLLRDETKKALWPNVVTAIGFVRAPAGHALLHEFIWGRFEDEVDLTTFQALIAAQGVLGHIATGHEELLYELIDGVDPAHWNGLPWTFEQYDGALLSLLWSKLTINALSYTGAPAARTTLTELRKAPHEPRQMSNIVEGLERLDQIAEVGLDAFERARDEKRAVR